MTKYNILNIFLVSIVCVKAVSVTTSADQNDANINNGDLSEIEVKHENDLISFFRGEPFGRSFHCKLPKSKFENRFEWLYLLKNGDYMPLIPEQTTSPKSTDALHYVDSVKLRFPGTDISHVVCMAFSKDSHLSYNSTYAVEIREALQPKILNRSSAEPMFHRTGKNIKLTCVADGDPLTFTWLKNGQPMECLSTDTVYSSNSRARSTLILEPSLSVDNVSSNKYTCVAENFVGKDSYTFQLDKKEELELNLV